MSTTNHTITIFLASSEELIYDRRCISSMIKDIDEILEPQGINICCKKWEDFFAFCTGTRTQDDYNHVLQHCDICLCMFHHKAGRYTIEEYEKAIEAYEQTNRPKTYVYMHDLVKGEVEEDSLKEFKKKLLDQGLSWNNYANINVLKYELLKIIEQFLIANHLQPDSSNITIESGYVLYYGHEITCMPNV